MRELGRGALEKMAVQLESGVPVQYAFRLGEGLVPVNPLIGRQIRLEYLGAIHCTHCGRKTNKSFSQGYCYPCFKKLPQCDTCIVSPERCHHELGTCRDPDWGTQFCMTDHVVYLANSSGIKVGITRATHAADALARSRARARRCRSCAWPLASSRVWWKTCCVARLPIAPTGVRCSRAMPSRST